MCLNFLSELYQVNLKTMGRVNRTLRVVRLAVPVSNGVVCNNIYGGLVEIFVYAFENCGIGIFLHCCLRQIVWITRPSVCPSIAFCGYSRLSLIKESKRFGSAGKFGHDFRDIEWSSDVSEAVVELSFV